MKKLIWIGLAAIVLLGGCSATGQYVDPLIGTWAGLRRPSVALIAFTFNSDSTFTQTLLGDTISGTYSDDVLTSEVHLISSGVSVGDWSYVYGPGRTTVTFTGISATVGTAILTRQ